MHVSVCICECMRVCGGRGGERVRERNDLNFKASNSTPYSFLGVI